MNTGTDLYSTIKGTAYWQDLQPQIVDAGLYWRAGNPSEIAISFKSGGVTETWRVGRDTFVAARQEWATGCWLGAGQFAVCWRNERCLISLRPHGGERCIVMLPETTVADFIDHTCALIEPGSIIERAANRAQVEKAIRRILT